MIITLCSVNPELLIKIEESAAEKPKLHDLTVDFTGSSVTAIQVALALKLKVQSFGLVGPRDSLYSSLLAHALNGNGKHVKCLEVLDDTSIAVVPFDTASEKQVKVYGKKGKIVPQKLAGACEELRRTVEGCDDDTIVALTGFREEEIPFAEVVFSRFPKGNRVMIPRPEFCPKLGRSELLSEIDCLVMNETEFASTGMTISELQQSGPRIVVVTQGRLGGYSFVGEERVQYSAFTFTHRESPGTGDWFMGAVLAFMENQKYSFKTVSSKEFRSALEFAARVAGEKAVMNGSKHGPSADRILELLKIS